MNFDNIKLDKAGSEPLYRQLAEQLKLAVSRGDLSEGEKLPPIRAWKEVLGISPVTATQAYEVLSDEGFTTGQVGRGTFVRSLNRKSLAVAEPIQNTLDKYNPGPAGYTTTTPSASLSEIITYQKFNRSTRVQRFLQGALARYQSSASSSDDMIVMSSGGPAPELFGVRRWEKAMSQAGESLSKDGILDEGRHQHLQYGSPLGDLPTREWMAGYLQRFGINCQADEVLLTTGSQQALDLVARVFMGPGDMVLVESPTYVSALEIFESRGINWLPVPLDENGLQLDVLERLAERYHPRLLYTVPTSQSPTGVTLSAERRVRLLELARRFNFLIIEDDTCNEFYYEAENLPHALKHYDAEGRVIYLKSFSKIIFPAVRFGLLVAQGTLMEKLAEAKSVFDRSTSTPLSRAVLKFVNHSAFETELREAWKLYRERRDSLRDNLEQELAGTGCRISRCEGGFSMLLTLPRGIRAEEFHLEAAEQGVAVLPGPVFYPVPAEAPDNTVRLSFGDNTPQRLEEAARRLSLALRNLQYRSQRQNRDAGFITAV
ncbi:MAG TPA: PLP-dependent aminotransferase family protein [Chloroflexia bacterium]|nr:PLP-dependent aminotransferase family protein [Chloroflexia bacterium]